MTDKQRLVQAKFNPRHRTLRNVTKAFWILSLVAIGATVFWIGWTYAKQGSAEPGELTSLESSLNGLRRANGAHPLVHSDVLTRFAGQRCDVLHPQGVINHDNWELPFNSHHHPFTHYGENLALDYSTDKGRLDAWMASPAHRATMLSDSYDYVGTAECGSITVQLFAK